MKKLFTIIISLFVVFMILPKDATRGVAEITYEETNVLAGKTISVMGDSISTYMGFSDTYPITSEDCTYRYGEPYYGEEDDDVHNNQYSIEDTWWKQAANALGAEMLVGNAGNSTALFCASYPNNANWETYLKDMLAYKSRPYYLGKDGKSPDIIALYIGSADVARATIDQFGSIDDIDMDALIVKNEDGSFSYSEPTTVAEAYSILLHKISVTYPNAEVYCFTVVPNAGGNLGTCNKRLQAVYPFNEMIKGVAKYYNANVVDLLEAFHLDPDKDQIASAESLDTFKSYFHEDPHPNALGFDVITKCFVEAVLENSKYIAEVETSAGNNEYILVDGQRNGLKVYKKAKNYESENGYIVNYNSTYTSNDFTSSFKETYTSKNKEDTYFADGGKQATTQKDTIGLSISVPATDSDNPYTEIDETTNVVYGRNEGIYYQDGDIRSDTNDGIYNYNELVVDKKAKVFVSTNMMQVIDYSSYGTNEGMDYLVSTTVPSSTNNLITNVTPLTLPQSKEDVPPITDGYEYVYIGSDKLSNFWAAYAYKNKDEVNYPDEEAIYADEEGNAFYVLVDHNVFIKRKLVVPRLYLENTSVEGTFPAWYDSVQQFTLATKEGEIVTTYCADQKTGAEIGHGYVVKNLDDATYYTADAAKKIRMIGRKGYWGTASGLGSLDAVKQMMRDSNKFSEEEIASLTDGIAMTATQYAIWTFSNEMQGMKFINAYYTTKGTPSLAAEKEDSDLIFKLYYHLINLDTFEIDNEKNTYNTIINENNYINDIVLTINGKDKSHLNNMDANENNDVYSANLAIKLIVKAKKDSDDNLALKIVNEDNEVIAVGRIVGEVQEGEIPLQLDGNGNYVFTNIPLEEGTQEIRVALEGTQYLANDVFLFTSEVKDGLSSQTMVGVAQGPRSVNIEMKLDFELKVDDEISTSQHVWRNERTLPHRPPETSDTSNKWFILFCFLVSSVYVGIHVKKSKSIG